MAGRAGFQHAEVRDMMMRTGMSRGDAKLAKCTELSRRVGARGWVEGCEKRVARTEVSRVAMGVRAKGGQTGGKGR